MSTPSNPHEVPRTVLLLGGRIHSPAAADATAMAIENGTVVWVGQDGPAKALYGDADETVHLDGAFVTPAFVDAHVHVTSAGLVLTGLDLSGCASLEECLRAVRARVERDGTGAVVWGHGWDESRWPQRRAPTRAEIDEAARGAAVYLSRVDVHSALVSSEMVRRAPAARAAAGWSPEGPLSQQAHHLVRAEAQRALPAAQRHEAQVAFLHHAAAHGVVCVHECGGPDISGAADFAEVLRLGRGESLPTVVGYWGERGAFDLVRELGAHGLAGDLFVDGALGSRTAALHEPYADAPGSRGAQYLQADEIAEHVVACTRAGVQAGFHVIGDAAVSAVVDGFAKAEQVVGREAIAGARHRLEHLEMVEGAQAQRLGSWGVVASVQPLFDAAWGGPDRMYAARLGADRGMRLNPFALLARSGMVLALGSDAPVTALDPWQAVRAAVHHRSAGSGISPRAAFTAHTRGGWRAAGVDDGVTGVLVPGAPAHYAVWEAGELVVAAPDARVQRWSTDPRSGVPGLPSVEPGAELPRCLRTAKYGRVIHDREGALT